MTAESVKTLSEERLAELARNLALDEDVIGEGYMGLILERKDQGWTSGCTILSIREINSKYRLSASQPKWIDNKPWRQLTSEEIVTFVQVARLVAPEARMTRMLVVEAEKYLAGERDKLLAQLEAINQIINFISPK